MEFIYQTGKITKHAYIWKTGTEIISINLETWIDEYFPEEAVKEKLAILLIYTWVCILVGGSRKWIRADTFSRVNSCVQTPNERPDFNTFFFLASSSSDQPCNVSTSSFHTFLYMHTRIYARKPPPARAFSSLTAWVDNVYYKNLMPIIWLFLFFF